MSREILAHFPREHLYVIVFERFIVDQSGEFSRLLEWLDLPAVQVVPFCVPDPTAVSLPICKPPTPLLSR